MPDLKGYMLFTQDEPIITSVRPHPAYAPIDEIKNENAEGWAECYNVHMTREAAEKEASDDFNSIQDAIISGDIENDGQEPDVVMAVTVSDDGSFKIFTDEHITVASSHTCNDMFDSFGMDVPETDDADISP